MDTLIIVFLLIFALGAIATLILLRRRGATAVVAKSKSPLGKNVGTTATWPGAPNLLQAAPPGVANGPKVRVLSVNGNAAPAGSAQPPLVKVPGVKTPVLKVATGGKPQLVVPATPSPKTTEKPGTGAMAHVTKLVNVPALCPICGLVEHADGCPGKH